MTDIESKTGSAEIVITPSGRFLRLIQIFPDGSPKHVEYIEMPKVRANQLTGQARWKGGSLLTVDQRTDESYQTKNRIA